MAINLVARMRVDDGLTQPMRRITRQLGETERATTRLSRRMAQNDTQFNRFRRTTTGLISGIGGLTRGFGGLVSKINPVSLAFSGIATAAAGAYGAVKIFNATVGEAMKMQQSQVVIGAMFNDKGLSDSYMKMMDKIAIKSPLLDSQAMYGNSKSFVAISKDTKQLEKMWNLTERLVASDPSQGLEGAVFALRELFSGDAVSMVDRFEMPRDIMNKVKKLPLDKQLAEMDKYMSKMGFTNELIEKMGNTAIGKWMQVKEKTQLILRDMGEPALKSVSNFLNKTLDRLDGKDMEKFGEWGGKVINKMVTGLSNNAIKLYDWFTGLMNDPAFKNQTTLTGKINFIVDDVAAKLHAWYEGGGKQQIVDFGSNVAQVMVSAMDATDEVFKLGAKLGTSVWSGILSGVKTSATESPMGKALNGLLSLSGIKGYYDSGSKFWNKVLPNKPAKTGKSSSSSGKFGAQKSHSGGLDRVPYSGYQAVLHKDEKVLTAQQARENREGKNGVSVSIGQLIIQGGGDMKSQAMEFLDHVTRMIESERGQMPL